MSAEALPITPARFAEALKDLSPSSLHLKVLELRNSIVHLDYSNEQLRPFAEGTEATLDSRRRQQRQGQAQEQEQEQRGAAQPDQDCIEAIRENEAVIARMQERILLVRAEVEARGFSWTEFQSKEEAEDAQRAAAAASAAAAATAAAPTNGVNGESHGDSNGSAPSAGGEEGRTGGGGEERGQHSAWGDGTFQTGTIRDGVVRFDGSGAQSASQGGGSLSDEELRRRLEQQLGDLEDDEEGGMHL